EMHFVERHVVFLMLSAAMLFATSLLAPRGVLRIGMALCLGAGLVTALTPLIGIEVNGAQRWIATPLGAFQPSEFLKPGLAIVIAAILASHQDTVHALPLGLALTAAAVGCLLMQPDLGMAALLGLVFGTQLFVAGLGWLWIGLFVLIGIGVVIGAYSLLPHVQARIDAFFDPGAQVYQVEQALGAVTAGGIFGKGPGEGEIKFNIPDAHADFIFAAAAEEFGIIIGIFLIGLFAFVIVKSLIRLGRTEDRFVMLAGVGLLASFGFQALINMGVNLNLMPTKGMTLPFVSYGGSSMLAMGISMGMLLALTRRDAKLEVTS
ncbi:MAG: FtsW/RodA/SpoVE family cell cycle protein, partial [Pseudomonadota bacterium]